MTNPIIAQLIEQLKALSDNERANVLNAFCKDCQKPIEELDSFWNTNYCFHCSPDPPDDRGF